MKVEALSRNVTKVLIPSEANKKWRWYLLLLSDVHFDSKKCDRGELKSALDKAVELQAGVVSLGDFLDCMQGQGDKRHRKRDLRPEYAAELDYIDAIIEDAAHFLRPYSERIIMLGDGNHESGLRKRGIETNLTTRLLQLLKFGTKCQAQYGHYAGYLKLAFQGMPGKPVTVYYHHGSGKRSDLSIERTVMARPDAQIYVMGDSHKPKELPMARHRLTERGQIKKEELLFIRCPSLKDGLADDAEGYETERGYNPLPTGAYWLEFSYDPTNKVVRYEKRKYL